MCGGCAVWQSWATDITHVQNRPYLSVVDTVSRFTMWRLLCNKCAREVCQHFQQLFSDFRPPDSLLSDNSTRSTTATCPIYYNIVRWSKSSVVFNSLRAARPLNVLNAVKRTSGTLEEPIFWFKNTRGVQLASPYEMVFSTRFHMSGEGCRLCA